MRVFTFPARYQRFVEAAIEVAVREVEADAKLRADNATRAKQLSWIEDEYINDAAHGSASVLLVGTRTSTPASIVSVTGSRTF